MTGPAGHSSGAGVTVQEEMQHQPDQATGTRATATKKPRGKPKKTKPEGGKLQQSERDKQDGPAPRKQRQDMLCQGYDEKDCIFGQDIGKKAWQHKGRTGETRCIFCSETLMKKAVTTARGRGGIVRILKKFYEVRTDDPEKTYDEAIKRVSMWAPEWKETLERSAKQAHRKRAAPKHIREKKAVEALEETWKRVKEMRQSTVAPANEQTRKKYRAAVLDDQKRVHNKFSVNVPRRPRATREQLLEAPDNDCSLPPATHSDLAKSFQRWCQRGAWTMHESCGALQCRKLRELDLRREPAPTITKSHCKYCGKKRQHIIPKPEDVPEPLLGLSQEALLALSPLDVDIGPEERATDQYNRPTGYRKHTRMTRFSWAARSVKEKLRDLPDQEMRRKAKKAFKYLKSHHELSINFFIIIILGNKRTREMTYIVHGVQ